jgi:GNAT superfamily N-acetyltransferase
VTVRLAGPGDRAALARLRCQWGDEWGETGIGEAEFAAAFSQWAAEHEGSHRAWLVELDGQAVGMAWLAVVERVPRPGKFSRRGGHLQCVYVVPGNRGNGVGAALVSAVVHEARRLGLDYLVVHPSERSFSLYPRAGFADSPGLLELDLRAAPS